MKRFALALLAVSALSGCKQSGPSTEKATAPKLETAEAVAKTLQKVGLPVADIKVVTAETDDNKLLGRPGQYTSKVYFTDTRHPKDPESPFSLDNTIEGFASIDAAKKRADYVGGIAKATPMFAQYIYQSGVFVVRLDKAVLPDEAKGYEAALKKIAG